MQYPWSTDNQTNTRAASEKAIRGGSVGGGLLVPEGHELDSQRDAGFGDLDDRDTHDAEDDLHVERFEGLGDELGAIGGGGHCGR